MNKNKYGGYELRRGDNDNQKKWCGSRSLFQTASYVGELQKDLKRLGVYLGKIDGDFGPATEMAVRMFKWNAKNVHYRVHSRRGAVADRSSCLWTTHGRVDAHTSGEIDRWLKSGYEATGDLVRVSMSSSKTFSPGSGYRKLEHPNIADDELVIAYPVVECLRMADLEASALSLKIVINQAFRVAGVPVSGAVVRPARKSQHLIGHAIDCNIVDGDNWNNSSAFAQGKETESAKQFIRAMKDNGMRWGGDFRDVDTPHFDLQLNANLEAFDFKYFFNQRIISERKDLPLVRW